MKHRLAAILCICCLAVGTAGCGDTAGETEKNNAGTKTEGADINKSDEEDKDSVQKDGQKIVVGGFQITLPEGITPLVNSEGMILSDENMNYQMLVTVRDYSFELKKEEPEFFAENVNKAGYKITRDVDIVEVAKREFAYFNYLNNGDNMLLAYSKADNTRTFATLIQRYGDLSDEALLIQVADILASAEKTDLPDTTMEDIEKQTEQSSESNILDYAKKVEAVEFEAGKTKFKVSVPKDFYMVSEDETGKQTGIFKSSDEEVNAYLHVIENLSYESPQDWLKEEVEVSEEAQKVSKSDIMQEKIGDTVVYYQIVSYEQKSGYQDKINTYLELYAICEVTEGVWLEVQADTREESGLNFDMVKDFFVLEK